MTNSGAYVAKPLEIRSRVSKKIIAIAIKTSVPAATERQMVPAVCAADVGVKVQM